MLGRGVGYNLIPSSLPPILHIDETICIITPELACNTIMKKIKIRHFFKIQFYKVIK